MDVEGLRAASASPLQLADRLIQLAKDAQQAGLCATAALLVGMAHVVLEPEAKLRG